MSKGIAYPICNCIQNDELEIVGVTSKWKQSYLVLDQMYCSRCIDLRHWGPSN